MLCIFETKIKCSQRTLFSENLEFLEGLTILVKDIPSKLDTCKIHLGIYFSAVKVVMDRIEVEKIKSLKQSSLIGRKSICHFLTKNKADETCDTSYFMSTKKLKDIDAYLQQHHENQETIVSIQNEIEELLLKCNKIKIVKNYEEDESTFKEIHKNMFGILLKGYEIVANFNAIYKKMEGNLASSKKVLTTDEHYSIKTDFLKCKEMIRAESANNNIMSTVNSIQQFQTSSSLMISSLKTCVNESQNIFIYAQSVKNFAELNKKNLNLFEVYSLQICSDIGEKFLSTPLGSCKEVLKNNYEDSLLALRGIEVKVLEFQSIVNSIQSACDNIQKEFVAAKRERESYGEFFLDDYEAYKNTFNKILENQRNCLPEINNINISLKKIEPFLFEAKDIFNKFIDEFKHLVEN